MRHASLRARRTGLLVAALSFAGALPGHVAGAEPTSGRTATASYPPSQYADPCEGRATVDLRRVTVEDLFEDDRATVRTGTVDVGFVLCAATSPGDLRTVRLDLHPRLDTDSGPDHSETPSRILTVDASAGGWTWRLRDADGTTTASGAASAVTDAAGDVTALVAAVDACRLAAASGATCAGDRRLDGAPAGPMPPLALRACTADVDCGPAYRTVDGETVPDPITPVPGVDYLPDPRHFPPTYPSICQVGGVARVPTAVPAPEVIAEPSVVAELERSGFTRLSELPDGRVRLRGSVEEAAALVGTDAVEAVAMRRQQQVPDDPYYAPDGPAAPTGQWSLRRVGLETAHRYTTGEGTRVGIIDSGFDGRHPDLVGRAVAVRDYVATRDGRIGTSLDRTADTDLGGHGTFVASVVAAATDDGVGMAALAPGTRLLVARVFDAEGCASDGAVVEAMAWAAASGAVAMNLSLGGPASSPTLEVAGVDAALRGAIPVAAAGNSGGLLLEYPAAYRAYLSVAATAFIDPDSPAEDPVAPYSTRNSSVDLAAPGGSNVSSQPSHDVLGACWVSAAVGRGYCRESGTSFAAPHVTAAVALVRSLDPDRTAEGTEEVLEDTARDIRTAPGTGPGYDDRTGAGRLDVGRATAALATRSDTLDDLPATADPSTASIAVSRTAFPDGGARHVVLARNDVFADSLAGAPLAGEAGPILLTEPARLQTGIETELQRVLPSGGRVWVLGGEAAVSSAVVERVRALGYSPARLHGPTRVHTAVAVARQVGPGPDGRVLVASAANWPDAIAGGAYAADRGIPLLLSWPDSAAPERSPGVLDAARDLGARDIVLLGGEAALSGRVFADLRDVAPTRRIAGGTRFATATAVARDLWQRTAFAPGQRFVIVNGDRAGGWAQGLASAPLTARWDAPLLLANDGLTTPEPAAYLRWILRYRLDRPAFGLLVGPPTATSEPLTVAYTAQRIRELLGG